MLFKRSMITSRWAATRNQVQSGLANRKYSATKRMQPQQDFSNPATKWFQPTTCIALGNKYESELNVATALATSPLNVDAHHSSKISGKLQMPNSEPWSVKTAVTCTKKNLTSSIVGPCSKKQYQRKHAILNNKPVQP
jgi:hypothetical protein